VKLKIAGRVVALVIALALVGIGAQSVVMAMDAVEPVSEELQDALALVVVGSIALSMGISQASDIVIDFFERGREPEPEN
jgi:hypothetical protein